MPLGVTLLVGVFLLGALHGMRVSSYGFAHAIDLLMRAGYLDREAFGKSATELERIAMERIVADCQQSRDEWLPPDHTLVGER